LDPTFDESRKKAFQYYSSALGKVLANADWLQKEKGRLSKMAEKPTMADEQKLFLYARLNILSFLHQQLQSVGGNPQDEL